MSEQPEALRLADALTEEHPFPRDIRLAAAELRRQHEEITELRHGAGVANQTIADLVAQRDALLEALRPFVTIGSGFDMEDVRKARAAILAVEEGK